MFNPTLLLLGIAWTFLLANINWRRQDLNRLLLLSFGLAMASTLAIRYGNTVERYFYGLNYFRDYIRSQFGFSNSALVAVVLAFSSVCLLAIDLNFRKVADRPKRQLIGIAISPSLQTK